MRAIVTCECCGNRQTVARPIRLPESFCVVCTDCEVTLRVEVTQFDLDHATTPTLLPDRGVARVARYSEWFAS